ncbi:hypothetical protein Y032_0036g3194 [Ancylostoma ceylanicum]|nr:hypothetical protein Y032_0036g3194 [Ancylostoma ceylanicum]
MKRKAEPDAEEMTSSKGPSTSKKLAPDATNDFINETSRRARGNWACLAEKMRRTTRPPRRAKKSDRSLRSTLRLFSMTSSDSEAEDDVYSLCVRDSPFCIDIALPEDRTSLRHIAGFDNTGNVRIWPGGEALAYYLSIRPPLVSGKLVLELGAGLIGLPGFIAAIYATRVRITDGNEHSVASLRDIAKRNPLPNVEIELLRWGAGPDEKKFDLILAADCVFFAEYHEDLVNTFDRYLAQTGLVYVCSPKRKGQVQFHPDVVAQVSALIWDTVSDDWTSDLLAFSSHGGRQAVNVSDVALIMRRNKHLLEIVSKAADIDLGDYERPTTKRQRSSNKESTRGRRGARSGTSRASTAMDGPGLRSGTLTPRSDQDANSRLSAVEEVKREAVLEQKATATIKTVDEEDFDDDDVMIVDAPAERPPLIEKGNSFEEDDFSMLDIDPAAATVSKPTVQNETPRRSARNALRATIGQGVDPRAENSTPRKNLQKSLVAKNLPSEKKNSPARAKRSPRKKTPSPDLFNTPVKENNSDEFDDLFEIPDQQQVGKGQSRQPSPKSAKNDVGAAPGKSERGWSVKFSEFSFFDDDLEVDQPSGEKGKAVQQPHDLGKPTTSAPPSRSKAMTSSVTPKSSLVTKSKLTRSGVKSSKQKNSAAALRSQEKQPLTTPKRTDALKSRLKDSAKKVSKPSAPALDDFDSDEEFFGL